VVIDEILEKFTSRATCLGISLIIITTATGDTATADGLADGEELPLTWFITEPQLVSTIPPTLILMTTLTITGTTIGTALPWGRINVRSSIMFFVATIDILWGNFHYLSGFSRKMFVFFGLQVFSKTFEKTEITE